MGTGPQRLKEKYREKTRKRLKRSHENVQLVEIVSIVNVLERKVEIIYRNPNALVEWVSYSHFFLLFYIPTVKDAVNYQKIR